MVRVSMNGTVSLARAMLILSGCLMFGVLIGLMPNNNAVNLRSASVQPRQQQQQHPTGGSSTAKPNLREVNDASPFSRFAWPAPEKEENRLLGEESSFVWAGSFAAIQNQALDTMDYSMDFSFSFEFEGSYSYDYDYYY